MTRLETEDYAGRLPTPPSSGLGLAACFAAALLVTFAALASPQLAGQEVEPAPSARNVTSVLEVELLTRGQLAELAQLPEAPRAEVRSSRLRRGLPGVGLPGIPADFSRYGAGVPPQSQWLGFFAELRGFTEEALANACLADVWGTASTHTCVATVGEGDWTLVYVPKRSAGPPPVSFDLYRTFYWETLEGGTAARPIVLTTADSNLYRSIQRLAGAAFGFGRFAFAGSHGWPLYIDNRVAPPASGEVLSGTAAPCDQALATVGQALEHARAACTGFVPGIASSGRLEMVLEP